MNPEGKPRPGSARAPLIRLLAGALAVLLVAAAPGHVAADDGANPPTNDLAGAPITDEGRARVIVALETDDADDTANDGEVAPTDRVRERAATARATERVTAALEDNDLDAKVARTFTWVPYLALQVDPDDLPALRELPGVASVVPDVEVHPLLDDSVPRIGASEPTPSYAGSDLDGAGTSVAVIDTGVEAGHPFIGTDRVLAEACFSQKGDCPNGGTEQFGEGAAAPLAGSSHGTHVAGIALGATGTTFGPEQGVAPNAGLIAVQAFSQNDDGGLVSSISDLTAAMEFVAEQVEVGIDVAAVNLSLGAAAGSNCNGGGSWDSFALAADGLREDGVLSVAASGNGGETEAISAPACLAEVVSVGATNGDDEVAHYSNVSDDTDVLAPGSKIRSSVLDGKYWSLTGTSMAAPHAAGSVALLRQAAPWAGAGDVRAALTTSLTRVDDQRDGGSVTDLPRLDVRSTLTAVPGAPDGPDAPPRVDTSAADGEVEVTWDPPDNAGASSIQRYDVLTRPDGATCSSENAEADPATNCTVTGLTNGTDYMFTVVASNDHGPGASSTAVEDSPTGQPSPPLGVQALAGTNEVTVSWNAPDDDGGHPIERYDVAVEAGDASCTSEDAAGEPATSCTVQGLDSDTSYTFTVTATNTAGATSAASEPSEAVSPDAATVPDPPTDVQATAGGDPGSALVSWTAPEQDGGSPLRGYTATADPDDGLCSSDAGTTSCTVTGLTGGAEYTFTVVATNDEGDSDPSAASAVFTAEEADAGGDDDSGGGGGGGLPPPDDEEPVEEPVEEEPVDEEPVDEEPEEVQRDEDFVSFSDVDPDATHGAEINILAQLGVVTGYDDGTYRPVEPVTRGQMASFLQRALGLAAGATDEFSDVDGTTHAAAIGAVATAGISRGYADGTYRPAEPVTRGQMASFLANAAELDEVADGPFSDVAGSVHVARINAVAKAGIASGYPDGTFRPGHEVTRAQMASFIVRLLDHLDGGA